MPYTRTEWINNSTKLNATNMNHIESGISGVEEAIIQTNVDLYNAQQQIITDRTASEVRDTVLDGKITTNTGNISTLNQEVGVLNGERVTYTDTDNSGNVVIAFRP